MTVKKFLTLGYCCLLGFASYAQSPVSPQDSVLTRASLQYQKPSLLNKIFLGKNYRKEWETPVQVPVFRLKALGLKILELGGGKQTKSLRLEDSRGREWVLRTIEKDVTPNLSPRLRNSIAHKVVQEMVSAAHPYAPLTIPTLAKAMGLPVPVPRLYYVGEGADLAPHRDLFAHQLCFLEEREPTPDKSDTKGTDNMLEDLVKKNDHLVLQREVLKARLLDMLVADWDRHADQWRWGNLDSAGADYYYAIPRDRDQAYFWSNGILVKIARTVAARHFVGFRYNLRQNTDLNFKAWKFDQTFLNSLDERTWNDVIRETQAQLSDSVITLAVQKMPAPIYAINGRTIEEKLKQRRNELLEAGLDYYRFLARTLTVHGTDEDEIFRLTKSGEDLLLTVHQEKSGQEGRTLFERIIKVPQTGELTLIALGGKDRFIIGAEVDTRLKVKIYGGKGADQYNVDGAVRATLIDSKSEGNNYSLSRGVRLKEVQ